MLTAMVRGSVLVSFAAAALLGCFRGGFLDDTCEQLSGGCGAGVTSGGMSSGGVPTTGGAASTSDGSGTGDASSGSTGDAPGIKFDGPAFRIVAMKIIDPHIFIQSPLCIDASAFINSGLTTSLQTKETNMILLARDFDPDAAQQEFWFYRAADCPPEQDYCLLDDLVPPTIFISFNRDDENCLVVDTDTINVGNLPDLNLPSPPCVVSPKASLPIQLTPELSPITFYQGQFAAHYEPDDQEPTEMRDAILFGFIPKTQAMMLEYNYNGSAINLWSVIRGSDAADACPVDMGHPSDVDLLDLDPNDPAPAEPGVFLYLNFTATKIDFYAPLPP